MGEAYGEVDGRRGLPDPTLQTDDGDMQIRFRRLPRRGVVVTGFSDGSLVSNQSRAATGVLTE